MLGVVEDWAEIRRLRRAEGLPISEIGRVLGISRNTVKRGLASHESPFLVRVVRGSSPLAGSALTCGYSPDRLRTVDQCQS